VIRQGEIRWIDLGDRRGSAPADRRSAVVISSDEFNDSRIATVIVAAITGNTSLAGIPGNVFLSSSSSGLPVDSVVNVTSIATIGKADLGDLVRPMPLHLWQELSAGLQLVLHSPFS
jgi:mRNA interferase MazF